MPALPVVWRGGEGSQPVPVASLEDQIVVGDRSARDHGNRGSESRSKHTAARLYLSCRVRSLCRIGGREVAFATCS